LPKTSWRCANSFNHLLGKSVLRENLKICGMTSIEEDESGQ